MRTSVRGICSRRPMRIRSRVHLLRSRPTGYTLVELLVVLTVIGITLGVAMLQLMPDNRAALRNEAQRLALLLENAELEAQSSGRSLAWSGENSHYRFWKKNDYNDWTRIEENSPFRARELPDGIKVTQTSIEEHTLKPGDKLALNAQGVWLPFRIRIGNQFGSASIIGNSTGEVTAALDNQINPP